MVVAGSLSQTTVCERRLLEEVLLWCHPSYRHHHGLKKRRVQPAAVLTRVPLHGENACLRTKRYGAGSAASFRLSSVQMGNNSCCCAGWRGRPLADGPFGHGQVDYPG